MRLYERVARSRTPLLDHALPPLSRAANYSRLWAAISAVLAAFGGRFGKRAAVRGLLSIGLTSALVNLVFKSIVRRPRPSLRVVPQVRRLPQPLTTSFPSGHAASAAAYERWLAPRLTVESDRPSLRLMRDGDSFEGSGSFEIAKPERKLVVYAPRRGE